MGSDFERRWQSNDSSWNAWAGRNGTAPDLNRSDFERGHRVRGQRASERNRTSWNSTNGTEQNDQDMQGKREKWEDEWRHYRHECVCEGMPNGTGTTIMRGVVREGSDDEREEEEKDEEDEESGQAEEEVEDERTADVTLREEETAETTGAPLLDEALSSAVLPALTTWKILVSVGVLAAYRCN